MRRVLALAIVCLASSAGFAQTSVLGDTPSDVHTDGSPSVTLGTGATEIQFEGIANLDSVGTIGDVSFLGTWVAAVDEDAGGTANIANEPSADTVAGVLAGVSSPIVFAVPAENVTFSYAIDTSVAGTAEAIVYDPAGNELGRLPMQVCGSTACGASCSGDPTGDLCNWTTIAYTDIDDVGIGSIMIEGAPGQWAIDNLSYTESAFPVEVQSFSVD